MREGGRREQMKMNELVTRKTGRKKTEKEEEVEHGGKETATREGKME